MDIKSHVMEKAKQAKQAAEAMAGIESAVKNNALNAMAESIDASRDTIISANEKDLANADSYGLTDAMVDRLTLTTGRLDAMSSALREIAAFPDPAGRVSEMTVRPSGIRVGRMSVPIGLIGFIYESRPNVTADAAGLCLKAGNAVLLRGGKEALHSNVMLAGLLNDAAVSAGIPDGAISIIEMTERDGVKHMIEAEGVVDLLIPRGGKGLIKAVVDGARVPVIKHYEGNCHVYIDKEAGITQALAIAVNAKTQRPGVCNAAETLLVHKDIAQDFLPRVASELAAKGVELRGCEQTRALIEGIGEADEDDWYTEYLDLVLAVRIVNSIDDAVTHINTYSSAHTEAIVTENIAAAEYFVQRVDSSSVMVNASTRFSDGGEYGLGAEIGISTDKLHARGPMGVGDLTTYKWIVYGNGNIRT